jgi:site-specific DNA-methyltransferase (adenine-specific)
MIELNKIILADCMDIMKDIPDKYFDLCLTDPPYNVNIKYNTHDDNFIDYNEWCLNWFNECFRISKCFIFTPGMVNLKFWYISTNPKWCFCWYKNNQNSPSALGGFNIWEPVLIYGKNKKRIGQDGFDIKIGIQKEASFHPVPKSLKAWAKIIELFTDENDSIIDPFSGSGTTACACHNLKRNFLAIEKDADYYKASCERLETLRSQGTLF